MVLTPHLLVGATFASKVKFLPLALGLAFLSHYLLDFLPHWEYSLENIKSKRWKKSLPEFLKIFLDISFGSFIIFILSGNLLLPPHQYIGSGGLALVGGFFAILPDGLVILGLIFPNRLLEIHSNFHHKIHFPKNKKILLFWGIFSQLLIMFVAIYFLL